MLSRTLQAPVRGLIHVWQAVVWPFRSTQKWLFLRWRRAKFRNLLFGLPAVTAVILLGILWQSARVNARSIETKYLDRARVAIQTDDYKAAEVFLLRILEGNDGNTRQARFDLAEVYERTDRGDKAGNIYRQLAPDDRRGFPPAHRKLAIVKAPGLTSQSTGDVIRLARHHLTCADGQGTPEMADAWARYYLALNQVAPAIERLEQAVQEYPELGMLLGDLYLVQGAQDHARQAYVHASQFLRKQLAIDPNNRAARAEHANSLLKLGNLQECQAVLELGLKLDPDGPYKNLLARLFTNRHDLLAQQQGTRISTLLSELRLALSYDPSFAPAYERLIQYGRANVENGGDLSEILADVIAGGKETGLAHFAMSIHKWEQGDVASAKWHLERAHNLLPDMPFVANNLAWILATETPVDFEAAEEILAPALASFPNEPRLLDTHATILMKQERWKEALDALEKALASQQKLSEREQLHTKLAEVCDQLDQPQIAEKHRAQAERLTRTLAEPAK